MKQYFKKKRVILHGQDNHRHDRVKTDVVNREIGMEMDRGYSTAARFLEEYGIRPDIIERVLRERLDKRNRT